MTPEEYDDEEVRRRIRGVEEGFQMAGSGLGIRESGGDVRSVVESAVVPAMEKLGLLG